MSDYHILSTTPETHEITAAFHFAVPAGNNAVGIPWRTARIQYKPSPGTTVPWLAESFAEEYAAIQSGAVYEHVATIGVNANLSTAQKLALMDAAFTRLQSEILGELANVLKYWGYNRDVS